MDVSKYLSKVMGIYLIIISMAMLIDMHQFMVNISVLLNDAPLMFVAGFFTLIIGLLAVVSHNIWQWNWRVLVTIIAWLTVIKGASIIFYPQYIEYASAQFVNSMSCAYIAAGIDLVLGLVLCYCGFRR